MPNWPAASPDLNPIENLWAIMKSDVSKARPQTIPDLEREIRNSWRNITLDCILNCINSMPNRLRLVLDNNGNHIPY